MLAQQAPRFRPNQQEVEAEILDLVQESAHDRIRRALEENNYDHPYFVRPLCVIATMAAKALTEDAVIQVFCPKDEARNARLPSGLRTGTLNLISVYPLMEEAYVQFADNMHRVGEGMGEYELFTRAADGSWQVKEFL